MLRPLDEASYEAWLSAMPPEATVGYTDLTQKCPIAIYTGAAYIGSIFYTDEGKALNTSQKLPAWAQHHVALVDCCARIGWDFSEIREIQAWQALELLRRAREVTP